jgi:hypothetical protein
MMSNAALQIQRADAGVVGLGDGVIFDNGVYAAGDIGYDTGTGIITFNAAGRYEVHWWVATQSSPSVTGAVFALKTSQGDDLVGNSPAKMGEVSGVGIINVDAPPVTAWLANASTGEFFYASQVPLKAALAVIEQGVIDPGNDLACFGTAQLAHLLPQMIQWYNGTTWSVFSLSLATYQAVPIDVYAAPGRTGPGFLRLAGAGDSVTALSIDSITAIYPGDDTVYNPGFTFLPPPDPLPPGCVGDKLAAIQAYLPLGTTVNSFRLGPNIAGSGMVYRNEFGLLVFSDEEGNTPIFVASTHLLAVGTDNSPVFFADGGRAGVKATIDILKNP